ncbi:MAG: hypothetical protein JWR69_3466 [Pedosphaera sp.]|nr:hypothetical protein [Pedosphaera sp.]
MALISNNSLLNMPHLGVIFSGRLSGKDPRADAAGRLKSQTYLRGAALVTSVSRRCLQDDIIAGVGEL